MPMGEKGKSRSKFNVRDGGASWRGKGRMYSSGELKKSRLGRGSRRGGVYCRGKKTQCNEKERV